MSFGGRGGGGYRGRGRGGGDSYRGRGGFNQQRFGYSSSSAYPAYDRKPHFNKGDGGDRFGNRGGPRDDSYRRAYRQENDYRDYVRLASPDPPRKRMRNVDMYGGTSPRRGLNSSYEHQSLRSGYSDKNGASGYERSYRESREREVGDFGGRKYRGRGMRSLRYRGTRRSFTTRTGFISKRRSDLRRNYMSDRADSYRLKDMRPKRRYRKDLTSEDEKIKSDDEEGSNEEIEEEIEEEEEVDEEVEEGLGDEEDDERKDVENGGDDGIQAVKEDEDMGEDGVEDGKAEKTEINKAKSKVEGKDNEGETDISGAVETGTDKKATKKKILKKKVIKKKIIKKKSEDKSEDLKKEKDDKDKSAVLSNILGRPYVNLKCPHCDISFVTFKQYTFHLSSKKHMMSLREVMNKTRQKLVAIRMDQREAQKKLDADNKDLHLRTFFCNICKLNYKTLKSEHQQSKTHRRIREILLPFCKICRIGFRTPVSYESHICDLIHIKRKARLESKRPKDDDLKEGDIDPSNFMVIDAVGSGDESDGSVSKDKDGDVKKSKDTNEIGTEYCKKVEVVYCELCDIYLIKKDDPKKVLTNHCRTRLHLQRYVKKKEREARAKAMAELEEKRAAQQAEHKVKKDAKSEESKESQSAAKENEEKEVDDEEEPMEEDGEEREDGEQNWNAVDKDLTELLNKAEEEFDGENQMSDDEEEGDRYDKFKTSKSSDIAVSDDERSQSPPPSEVQGAASK